MYINFIVGTISSNLHIKTIQHSCKALSRKAEHTKRNHFVNTVLVGLSAGTGKLCIFGHLGLVFIWSCFVSRLLFLLYYVICAPVLTEGTVLVQ